MVFPPESGNMKNHGLWEHKFQSELVLCEYSKFRIQSNSYFSIRFETSTIVRNFRILTRYQFLTYFTAWRRFSTL